MSSLLPLDGPCYLLNIPRELRDMIWEYALTEENGLLVQHEVAQSFRLNLGPEEKNNLQVNNDSEIEVRDKSLLEANQLKFVNYQLYEETRGLGLKLNELTFTGNNNCDVHLQFGNFLEFCPERYRRRIRKVYLTPYTSTERIKDPDTVMTEMRLHLDQQVMRPTTDFCHSYPEIKVHVQLQYFGPCCDPWIRALIATIFVKCMRAKGDLSRRPVHALPGTFGRQIAEGELRFSNFENLRFFPTGSFDEEEWRRDRRVQGIFGRRPERLDHMIKESRGGTRTGCEDYP